MPCVGQIGSQLCDALGVVPHPVAVDDAGRRRASAMPSIRPSTCAGTPDSMRCGRRAQPRRPVAARTRSWLPPMPPEVTIDGLRAELEVADRVRASWPRRAPHVAGLEHGAAHAVDRAVGRRRARRPGAGTRSSTRPARGRLAHAPDERLDDAGAGAPGDVEARHRVAVPVGEVAAALGPADDREPAARPARAARRASRRRRSRRRPRPSGAASASSARSNPAVPSQSCQASSSGVLDAHPALLGGVDEEQAAERPERLAAERRLGLLVEQDHPPAGVGELGGGDQPGQPGPDDDDIGVGIRIGHPRELTLARWASRFASNRLAAASKPFMNSLISSRDSPPRRTAPRARGRAAGAAPG